MNLDEKIARSKSDENIDFSKISCLHKDDPLVPVLNSEKIKVEPVWTVSGDFEGKMYADYITSHPDYNQIYLRTGALKLLKKAANSLESKYKLVVRAGHRPIEVQKRLLHDVMQDFKKNNPQASDKEALDHAREFVSDPDIKLPEHCCGAAVDVDLYDNVEKRFVDFGSTQNDDSDISYLHSDKITPVQKQNRLFLLKTMLKVGFASYYAEWWHYSYGDQIWAWFYRKKSSLYGLAQI